MPDYFDAYLAPLIAKTPSTKPRRCGRGATGNLPAPWPDKLTVLRAYVLLCLESSASAEDVFSLKLKQYQTEWKDAVSQAMLALNVAAALPARSLFIPLSAADDPV